MNDSRCANCGEHEWACDCYACDDCGDMVTRCEHCADCPECDCECEDVSIKYVYHSNHPVFHPASKLDFAINPVDRYLGCELELSGAVTDKAIQAVASAWRMNIVEDGTTGVSAEVNTQPAKGDVFLRQIKELTEAFKTDGAEVSKACGYHVHVDARDLDFQAIRRLILIYEKIEDAVFEMVPPSRRNNSWARRTSTWLANGAHTSEAKRDARGFVLKKSVIGNAQSQMVQSRPGRRLIAHSYPRGFVRAAQGMVRIPQYATDACNYDDCESHWRARIIGPLPAEPPAPDPGKLVENWRLGIRRHGGRHNIAIDKYLAMNLGSFFTRGTVEIRLAAGTVNYDKVVNWAMLWGNILCAASSMSEKEVTALPEGLDTLLTLSPTDSVREWVQLRHDKFNGK